MILEKKLLVIGAVSVGMVVCGASALAVAGNKPIAFQGKADPTAYSLTFDSNCVRQQTSSGNDYAYAYSSGNNKYGAIVKNTTGEHASDDFFVLKGTSNFIKFSFGDIAADGSFEEANFNGGITSVSINAMYTYTSTSNVYARVYFSDTTMFDTSSSSKRKGYAVQQDEYTTVNFDLSAVENCNYIEIGTSHGFSEMHIKSITINYACNAIDPGVTFDSISIEGGTTQYTIGDTFNFDGTVTAHYSDGSSKDVTSYAVVDEEPAMDYPGYPHAVISYTENEVKRSVNFTIHVSEQEGRHPIVYRCYDDSSADGYCPVFGIDLENSVLPSSFVYDGESTNTIELTIAVLDGYAFYGFATNDEAVDETIAYDDVRNVWTFNAPDKAVIVCFFVF